MSDFIKEYYPGTPEYDNLKIAAVLMTRFNQKGIEYRVETTYFDYGQDWLWTTIIAYDPKGNGCLHSWQALYPRLQETIVTASNPETIIAAINKIINQ